MNTVSTNSNSQSAGEPLVTIGVPVYNGENYLVAALDALLAQTFADFELVISDNASTDGTEQICRDYAARDKRIRYIRHDRNGGGIWNFNYVFEVSRGKYFKWAAHDDLHAPTFLERCVEVLQADPEVVWCHTEVTPIDAAGQPLRVPSDERLAWATEPEIKLEPDGQRPLRGRRAATPHARYHGVLLGRSYCLDTYGLIRRSALLQTRRMLPFWGPEKVLIAELALLGRYEQIGEPLFFFRLHEEASSALPTTKQQREWFDPSGSWRATFPRCQLLCGYLTAPWRLPCSLSTRLRCLGSVTRYLLQFHKWGGVMASILGRTGIGGSGRTFLDECKEYERLEGVESPPDVPSKQTVT